MMLFSTVIGEKLYVENGRPTIIAVDFNTRKKVDTRALKDVDIRKYSWEKFKDGLKKDKVQYFFALFSPMVIDDEYIDEIQRIVGEPRVAIVDSILNLAEGVRKLGKEKYAKGVLSTGLDLLNTGDFYFDGYYVDEEYEDLRQELMDLATKTRMLYDRDETPSWHEVLDRWKPSDGANDGIYVREDFWMDDRYEWSTM